MPTYTGTLFPTAQTHRYNTVAVSPDGTISGWGRENNQDTTLPLPSPAITGVVSVSLNRGYGLALKGDGTVVAWGSPRIDKGQTAVPATLGPVISVAAGLDHAMALQSDGTVVAWGGNVSGEAAVPAGLTGVAMIAAGENYSVALKSDGTLVDWGVPISAMPAGLTDVVYIDMTYAHVLALKGDGTVVSWGNNVQGQREVPAGLTDVTWVAAGAGASMALKTDGSIVYWGDDSFGITLTPAGLSGVKAIYQGFQNAIALKTDGSIVMWGNDSFGESTPPAGFEVLLPDSPPPVIGQIAATVPVQFSGSATVTAIGQIAATVPVQFSGSAFVTVFGQIAATVPVQLSGVAFEDWVANLPPLELNRSYILTITGGVEFEDIVVPASSWQATLQATGRDTFLQAVIPAARDNLEALSERASGDLIISGRYIFSDGTSREEEIIRSKFDSFRYDRGPERITATVSGYFPSQDLQESASRQLSGVRSISCTDGKYRVRCNVDFFLRPGMTVSTDNVSFRADYINYFVSTSDQFSEVSQR